VIVPNRDIQDVITSNPQNISIEIIPMDNTKTNNGNSPYIIGISLIIVPVIVGIFISRGYAKRI